MEVVGLQELEALMPVVLAEDSETYLNDHGFAFKGVGVWCGGIARSAVDSLGITEDDPRYREIGAAITTAALCSFEMGVRASRFEVPA